MTLDLTDLEAALLLKELNGLIDGDRYFLSVRFDRLSNVRDAKLFTGDFVIMAGDFVILVRV